MQVAAVCVCMCVLCMCVCVCVCVRARAHVCVCAIISYLASLNISGTVYEEHGWLWFTSPLNILPATLYPLPRYHEDELITTAFGTKTILRASLFRLFHFSSTTFTRLTDLHSFSSTSSRARPCQPKDCKKIFWKLPILFCAFLAGSPCLQHTRTHTHTSTASGFLPVKAHNSPS